MKHIFEQKVYYSDTDAYGVVWHGAYLRWLERGRVDLIEKVGFDLAELKENDVVLPVTSMNLRYKASAKLNDVVVIETRISKVSTLTATFSQVVKSKNTDKIFVQAEVEGVAVNNEGRLYRRMPENIRQAFENAIKE